MKMTLLEMVQSILSSMDSDEVNSYADTVESQQVANIIKSTYNDIISFIEFPEQYKLFQLNPSGDPSKPVVMSIPNNYGNLEWVKYNKEGTSTGNVGSSQAWTSPDGLTVYFGNSEATWSSGSATGGDYEQFKPITFLQREDFLKQVQSLNDNNPTVTKYTLSVEGVNIPLLCRNDKQPEYYTVFSGKTICFDSYDISVDATLQASKTMCYGKKNPVFILSDTYIPELDDKYFSILFNEAKSLCFSELKQLTNLKAEKASRRGWIKSQKAKDNVPYENAATNHLPNYGRRR